MPASCISIIRHYPGPGPPPHNGQTYLNTQFYLTCHTKRSVCVYSPQCEWSGERASQSDKDGKIQRSRLYFFSPQPTVVSQRYYRTYIQLILNLFQKPEGKNNISPGNLGSGETCLTGTADYWSIFNRVDRFAVVHAAALLEQAPMSPLLSGHFLDVRYGEIHRRQAELLFLNLPISLQMQTDNDENNLNYW